MKRSLFASFLCLLLAASLCFCACAANKTIDEGYLLTDGKKSVPDFVLQIGDKKIDFPTFRHFYLNTKTDYDAGDADYFSNHPEKETELKETVLSYLKQACAVETLANEYGVTLSDADKSAVSAEIAETRETLGAEGFDTQLSSYYLTEETYQTLMLQNALYDNVYQTLTGEGGALFVTEEDYAAHLAESYLCYAQIYVNFKQGEGTSTYEKTSSVANEAFQRLQNGEDFYTVAFALSDDAEQFTYKNGYLRLKTTFPDSLRAPLETLAENAYSTPILADDGIYILLRLPIGEAVMAENRDYIIQGYDNTDGSHVNGLNEDRFAALVDQTASELSVEFFSVYDKITPSTLY